MAALQLLPVAWLPGAALCAAASSYVFLKLVNSRPKSTAAHKEVAEEQKGDEDAWTTLDFTNTQPVSPDFDWTKVEERPHRPWPNATHHVTMGLKKTCLDDWVEIDKSYLSRYEYKRYLYAKHPEDTVQHMPGSDEPSFEALFYLVDFLPRRYPSMFARTQHGIRNLVTGDDWDLRRDSSNKTWDTYHPLQVMGLLTTEDWFIMQVGSDGQTTRLTAGANCFPAGWRLRERIGLSLWQIHAGKVPQYEDRLSVGMDRFFLRLKASAPITRFNYAIDISPELFHIESHHNLTADALAEPLTADKLHVRVERQFLQRLPRTGAITFSIRTYVTPVTEVTRDKEVARALRTNVASYAPSVAVYKNKHLWGEVLDAHLAEVLGE